VVDKEPAGESDEPTPADDLVDPEAEAAAAADDRGDELADDRVEGSADEPTGAQLAASGADTEGDPDTEPNGNGVSADDREPVTVGAAAAGGRRGAGKTARSEGESAAAQGKGRATRKRDSAEPAKKRTGPVTFVRESVGELRKVVYPTGQQLVNYFVVVLIFVLFVIAYVSLLDLGFGWAMFQIFA
jgi:preprotein translocase subunit SecE